MLTLADAWRQYPAGNAGILPVFVERASCLPKCSRLGSLHDLSGLKPELRANGPELERGFGFNDCAVHLKERINKEIDRSAFRFRIDHQIAALRQFKSVRWIMTKIIIRELWVLPRFTDIHRNPLTVREKFGPAMIALDLAIILVGWNGRADCETRGYVDA